jgi:Ca2+-binding RTX toxin-like protein
LTGGLGDDSYVVENAGDRVVESVDGGNDTVYANNVNWSIELQSPNVETLVVLSSNRIGAGSSQADRITAYGNDDTLIGAGGNDTLAIFGAGGVMYGGAGDDIFVVTSATTQVVENAGEGSDTIYAYVDFSLASSGANIEALVMAGNGKVGSGTAGNDLLIAGGVSNYLFGGAGSDTFGLNAGHGASNVLDFTIGQDKVALSSATFANFAAMQANASQVGANTVINGTGGDTFILTNVSLASLSASDFMFV